MKITKKNFKREMAKKHALLAKSVQNGDIRMFDCTSQTEDIRKRYGNRAVRVFI